VSPLRISRTGLTDGDDSEPSDDEIANALLLEKREGEPAEGIKAALLSLSLVVLRIANHDPSLPEAAGKLGREQFAVKKSE
jgi:hypothetical protein